MTKRIWYPAISLLLILAIHTFINFTNVSNLHTEQSITIGYSNWVGWWPWAIAEKKGLFAQNGIDVRLKWYDNYTLSLKDLAAGVIDGNCQTLNDTISFAADAVEGEVVVLVNDNSAGNDKIIAADGINTVKELKDKQVAIEAEVVNDFLLTLALEREGMSRDDVKIINIETGAAVEAFVMGLTDAVGAFPPFWLTAFSREGAKEIVSSKDFPGAISDLLVVTEKLSVLHPQKVKALVQTWFDTLDYIKIHPFESELIMMERAGINLEEFQLFKAGTNIFNLGDNIAAFQKGRNMKSLHYAAKRINKFLLNEGLIDRKLKTSNLLNSQFIKEVNNERQQ